MNTVPSSPQQHAGESTGHASERAEKEFVNASGVQFFAFSNGYSPLSNYHMAAFNVDGTRYRSMEQYIGAQMALCASDFKAYQHIMEESTPRKYLDIKIRNINYDKWDQIAEATIMRGLMKKFEQNRKCREKLLSTGSATIIHATTRDRILGTGLDIDNTDNMDSYKWLGLNELGLMLMEVRDNLQMMDTPSPEMITLE